MTCQTFALPFTFCHKSGPSQPASWHYRLFYCPVLADDRCSLLYHTSLILTHRPFWHTPVHYEECRSAAHSIEKLLALLETTFGFENITYLIAYCIYVGATVLVGGLRRGDETCSSRIQIFTRALRTGAEKCFLLKRSLDIIEQGVAASSTVPHSVVSTGAPVPSTSHHSHGGFAHRLSADTNGSLPAFPYLGYTALDNAGMGFNAETFETMGAAGIINFSPLESFFGSPQAMQTTGHSSSFSLR